MFLSCHPTGVDHMQLPAGMRTRAPSVASSMAACTSGCVQLTAVISPAEASVDGTSERNAMASRIGVLVGDICRVLLTYSQTERVVSKPSTTAFAGFRFFSYVVSGGRPRT